MLLVYLDDSLGGWPFLVGESSTKSKNIINVKHILHSSKQHNIMNIHLLNTMSSALA